MLRNTATSWIFQSLNCHIRIPDPLVVLKYSYFLCFLCVISHSEVFLLFLPQMPFPHSLVYLLPLSPLPIFVREHEHCYFSAAEKYCGFCSLWELCWICLHSCASQCQPVHTYQTGSARDYWVNRHSAICNLTHIHTHTLKHKWRLQNVLLSLLTPNLLPAQQAHTFVCRHFVAK